MSNRSRLAVYAGLATLLCSAALGPVFGGLSWLLPVAGAIAIVAGVGELGRRFGVPLALTPLLAVGGVLVYVTTIFANRSAVGHVLPGPGALATLRQLVQEGFADIRVLSPPVPSRAGMVLITVVGVAAVALVVDLLAVTLRHASLAGLPLLALYAVPAAVVVDGVGWLPFVLGGVGYLGLLLADSRDRLARWGRPLGLGRAATAATPDAVEYAETSPLAAVGRRIGVAALGVAVVVPALIPGLHPGLFGGGGNGLPTSDGSDTVATYNPIARLQGYLVQKDPKELMRVTTSDSDPGYLRMVALDLFDGTTWSESPLSVSKNSRISKGRLPAPDGLGRDVKTMKVEAKIKVRDLDVHWLPVPYPATNVKVKGWNYDSATATIFSTRASTRRMTYSVVSRKVTPDSEQLRKAPAADSRLEPFLALPGLPDEIVSRVAGLTANKPNAYARALAIQDFFRTGFRYDVNAPAGNGESALVTFLTRKSGYCEQFAAAMAVFARQAQIPARVAIGFTRGERQSDGSWRVTTADAHAWPELYFEGAGWLRFEPTPLGEGRAVDPDYTVTPNNPGPGPTTGSGGDDPGDPTAKDPILNKLDRTLEDDTVALPPADLMTADGERSSSPVLRLVLLGLLVAALVAFPAVSRAVVRRRRWAAATSPAGRAHAAWAELRDDASDFGHAWAGSDSPRAAGSGLIHRAGLSGAAAGAVRLLVGAEERARYSRQPADAGDLRAAVGSARAALRARATAGRRWQVRLVPRSSMALVGMAAGTMADTFGAADLALARLRGRLLRRSPA